MYTGMCTRYTYSPLFRQRLRYHEGASLDGYLWFSITILTKVCDYPTNVHKHRMARERGVAALGLKTGDTRAVSPVLGWAWCC